MNRRPPLLHRRASDADWSATGTWTGEEWIVEMDRALRTDHPADTKQLQAGDVYTWSPAVHHGVGQRRHWVAYPYRLGLGIEPEPIGDAGDQSTVVATQITDGPPDWDAIETHTIPLVFPGVTSWTNLTDDDHPRSAAVKRLETTVWDLGLGTPSNLD